MTFRFRPDQVEQAWATVKIEVVFAPNTGSIKPWELYGVFTFPRPMRRHWGSFRTQDAANKKAEAFRNNILRRERAEP